MVQRIKRPRPEVTMGRPRPSGGVIGNLARMVKKAAGVQQQAPQAPGVVPREATPMQKPVNTPMPGLTSQVVGQTAQIQSPESMLAAEKLRKARLKPTLMG